MFLKRSQSQPVAQDFTPKTLDIGKFLFQPEELILSINGDIRNLTLKEAELINIFVENLNKVLSRNEILEKSYEGILKEFLSHCDLVKFAEYAPTNEEIQMTFDSCKGFIMSMRILDSLAPELF